MNRNLLQQMLVSHHELKREGAAFSVGEHHAFELLLLSANGAPSPLPRVQKIHLHEAFVTVNCSESSYSFPYSVLMGFKIGHRSRSRAGFHN